jgi:hypothetical protein
MQSEDEKAVEFTTGASANSALDRMTSCRFASGVVCIRCRTGCAESCRTFFSGGSRARSLYADCDLSEGLAYFFFFFRRAQPSVPQPLSVQCARRAPSDSATAHAAGSGQIAAATAALGYEALAGTEQIRLSLRKRLTATAAAPESVKTATSKQGCLSNRRFIVVDAGKERCDTLK